MSLLDNPGSGPWQNPFVPPDDWTPAPYTNQDIFEEIDDLFKKIDDGFKFAPEGGGLKLKNFPSIPIGLTGPTVAGSGTEEVTEPVTDPVTTPKTDTNPTPFVPVDDPNNRPDPEKTQTPAPTPPAVINNPIPEGKPGGGRMPLPGR